jgi:O-antigen/teichoic acid export membrane protein
VALVASGTAGAQAITIAFAPILTRIYGPEAFGLFGTFTAIVAVATPAAAMAYPIAIVLPRSDRDALDLARLSAILSFAVAVLVAAALWVAGDSLTAALDAESVSGFLFLIPVAMLFVAWTQIAQQWLIRSKEFAIIARFAVAHSLILNSAKCGIGWLNPVGSVLIILATFGHGLYAALLFVGARRRYQQCVTHHNNHRRMPLTVLARRYRDFPLYRAPQNFINAASQSLPILLLAAFYGSLAAGFYVLGKMVMAMPSALVGNAVSDVFYPHITEANHNRENLTRYIVRATGVMFVIAILPFGLVFLFGPWLFSLVFGSDWVMAGEYARWLAILFFFNFINRPSVAAVPVLGIQRGLLVYELFSTGGKAIAFLVGFYWFRSDIWAIALFSVVGAVAYILMILWILRHAIGYRHNAEAS